MAQRALRYTLDMEYGFGGFFNLRTPVDMFAKLRHDYQRLQSAPADSATAFDFFVTAHHLVDWLHPKDPAAQRHLRSTAAVPRICEHLANGAKHFSLNRRHESIAHADAPSPVFDGQRCDPAIFDTEPTLLITLEGDEAAAMGQASFTAPQLAQRVLAYWKTRLQAQDGTSSTT